MTDMRRPVSLHPDAVRNARAGGSKSAALTLGTPFNDTSDRIREGGCVLFDGTLYEVVRREDLPPHRGGAHDRVLAEGARERRLSRGGVRVRQTVDWCGAK
jgi:hypothetical protein